MKMKSLICCALFLILPGLAAAEPQVILDTDFGVRGKSFEEIIAAKGVRITGSLPKGWGDNSNWKNNVVADYKPDKRGRATVPAQSNRPPETVCSSCTGCREWKRKTPIIA